MNQDEVIETLAEPSKNKFSEILGINENLSDSKFSLKFKDKIIEKKYSRILHLNNRNLKIIYHFLLILYFIYRLILDSLIKINYLQIINYIFIFLWVSIFVLYICEKNLNKKQTVNFILSILLIIITNYSSLILMSNNQTEIHDYSSDNSVALNDQKGNIYNSSIGIMDLININNLRINFSENFILFYNSNKTLNLIMNNTDFDILNNKLINEGRNQIREFYLMLVFSFLEILVSYEINFLFCLIVFLIALFTGISLLVLKILENGFIVFDFLVCLISLIIAFSVKKNFSLKSRENFIKNYKLKRYYIYCNDLINNMNGFQFTIKDRDVIVYNQNFEKTVSDFYNNKILEKKGFESDKKNQNDEKFKNKNNFNLTDKSKDNDNNNNICKNSQKENQNIMIQDDKSSSIRNCKNYSERPLISNDKKKNNFGGFNFKALGKNKETKDINQQNLGVSVNQNNIYDSNLKLLNKNQEIYEKDNEDFNLNINRLNDDKTNSQNKIENKPNIEETNKINRKKKKTKHKTKINENFTLGLKNYKTLISKNKQDLLMRMQNETNMNIYLEGIKPIKLEKDYEDFKADNLLEISMKIQNDFNLAEKNSKTDLIQKELKNEMNLIDIGNTKKKDNKFNEKISEVLPKSNKRINIQKNNDNINFVERQETGRMFDFPKFEKFIENNILGKIDKIDCNESEIDRNSSNKKEINKNDQKEIKSLKNNSNLIHEQISDDIEVIEKNFKNLKSDEKNIEKGSNLNFKIEKGNCNHNKNNSSNNEIEKPEKEKISNFNFTFKKCQLKRTNTIIIDKDKSLNKKLLKSKQQQSLKNSFQEETLFINENLSDEENEDYELERKIENNKFILLGEFFREDNKKYYQVYFRKLTIYDSIVDFLMYDMTYIKEAEKFEMNLKTKFFAKIAHEFKTPVNSIIGLIKQIYVYIENQNNSSEDELNDDNKNQNNKTNLSYNPNFIETKKILSQVENLSNYVIFLINDMIEYSNIKEKSLSNANEDAKNTKDNNNNISNMNLKIEKINLKEISEFCKDITSTLIISKGKERSVKIINDFDPKIDQLFLLSDEFRMKQILLNFISNSVKFTKSGYIKIKSEILMNDPIQGENTMFPNCFNINNKLNNNNDIPNNNLSQSCNINNAIAGPKIKISIIDTGMGIKKNDLDSLLKFEDNTMLKSTGNMNQGGSGLGLSITKFLSEKLNHEMEVKSDYGKGSQFSVIIKSLIEGSEIQNKEKQKQSYLKFANKLKKSKIFIKSFNNKKSLNEINSLYRKQTIQDLLIKKNLENFKNNMKRKMINLNNSGKENENIDKNYSNNIKLECRSDNVYTNNILANSCFNITTLKSNPDMKQNASDDKTTSSKLKNFGKRNVTNKINREKNNYNSNNLAKYDENSSFEILKSPKNNNYNSNSNVFFNLAPQESLNFKSEARLSSEKNLSKCLNSLMTNSLNNANSQKYFYNLTNSNNDISGFNLNHFDTHNNDFIGFNYKEERPPPFSLTDNEMESKTISNNNNINNISYFNNKIVTYETQGNNLYSKTKSGVSTLKKDSSGSNNFNKLVNMNSSNFANSNSNTLNNNSNIKILNNNSNNQIQNNSNLNKLKKSGIVKFNSINNPNLVIKKLQTRINEVADENLTDSEREKRLFVETRDLFKDNISSINRSFDDKVNKKKGLNYNYDLSNVKKDNSDNQEINLENENLQICDIDYKTNEYASSKRLVEELKKNMEIQKLANLNDKNKDRVNYSPRVLKEKTSSCSVNFSNKNYITKDQKLNQFHSHSSDNSNTSKGENLSNLTNRPIKTHNKLCSTKLKEFNNTPNFNKNYEEECIHIKSDSIMQSSSGYSQGSRDDTIIIEELNLNFRNSDIKMNLLKKIKIKNKSKNQNADNVSLSEYSSLSNPNIIIDSKNNPKCNFCLNNPEKPETNLSNNNKFRGRTISPSFKQNKSNKDYETQTPKVSSQSNITNVNQLNINNININSNDKIDLFKDIANCFCSGNTIDQVFLTDALNSNLKNLKENHKENNNNLESGNLQISKNSRNLYENEKLNLSSLKKTLKYNHNTEFSLGNSKNLNMISEDTKAYFPVNNNEEVKTDITDSINKNRRSLIKNLLNPISNEDILLKTVKNEYPNDLDFLNINTDNSISNLEKNEKNSNLITDNQNKSQSNNHSRKRKSKIKKNENSKINSNVLSPTKVNSNLEDLKNKNKVNNTIVKNFSNTNIILKQDLREIAEQSNLDINEAEIETFKITKYKILIVDDHKFLRESLKNIILKILKKRNILKYFEVIEGFDGVDILYHIINDQAQNNLIKCVITDENMEYINGSQAIKIIKELETELKIKPIALASITAYSDEFMKDQAGGIDCFLPKPCSEKYLLKFFEDFNIFYCEE